MTSLQGKTALVTGGGQGIGQGITEALLAAGARVVIASRGAPDAAWLAAAGGALSWIACDLSAPAEITALAAAVAAEPGGPDILVNNAGRMAEARVTAMSLADWNAMLAVNLTAPFLLTQAVVPAMAARGGGAIVNIGSIEGLGANPLHAAYCATKGGVHAMTKALAVDLGAQGIRVNAIAPGWINTALVEDYVAAIPDRPAFEAELAGIHPLRRSGQPADIGRVAAFLAGEAAGFITGEVLVVDGGRTAQLSSPAALRE